MNNQNKEGFFSSLQNDIPAAVVVFLVALPLCLGIALASGAPLFSGIIAGIVGGTVVALLSGSPLGVSGPAAGLAVLVATSIGDMGGFEAFMVAVIIGGVIQIGLGFLKAGIIGYYFPSSVIKGMLSGIGIIISIKQIKYAFGYNKAFTGEKTMDNALEFVNLPGDSIGQMMEYITPGALLICGVSLAILILWEQKFIKNIKALKLVPGPLIAVGAGIGLNIAFQGSDQFALISKNMVSIPESDSIGGFFELFAFPDFSALANPQVYVIGFTIAIVASLETLLCVEASDKLDPLKRITPTNRELLAQGTGNIVSGFIGGLPITQVIVRSSANVQAGGRTKASAFFHGVLLLICVMTIPFVLNMIPLASLAAILFVVGYKLAKPALFKDMYKQGWAQFIPFLITVLGIAITGDLLIGIGLGVAIGIFQILRNNYKNPYNFNAKDHVSGETITIALAEEVSFLNKAGIQKSLNEIPDNTKVIIDASRTKSVHADVLEIIDDFTENAKTRGIEVKLEGLSDKEENSVKEFHHLVLTRNKNA